MEGIRTLRTSLLVGVLAATCMAAQVSSPWLRQGVLKFKPLSGLPVTSVPLAHPVAPVAASAESKPLRPITPNETSVMTASNAGAARTERCSILGGFFRLVFGLVGTALLLAAMAGALALAYDIPCVLAVGGFGPEPARDLARTFDTPNWPSILRAFIALGMFVVALGYLYPLLLALLVFGVVVVLLAFAPAIWQSSLDPRPPSWPSSTASRLPGSSRSRPGCVVGIGSGWRAS